MMAIMGADTDVSSHHTTATATDSTTPLTNPDHTAISDSVSVPQNWACDCPTVPSLLHADNRKCQHHCEQYELDRDSSSSHSTSSFRNVEELYKRSLDHFPNPDFTFPMPSLEFDFRIAVTLKPVLSRSDNHAHKEVITVESGTWSGSFGNGRVLAGGYDLGQARGFRPIRIVEGAYVLQTSEQIPAVFEMRTRGSLSGPCNILDTLLSPQQPKDIDPRQYSFRMFSTVKAADKRYAELVNCGLWVACGVWKDHELIIDAFRVT